MYTAMFAALLMMASCGNSNKRKVTGREVMEQRAPQGTIIESQTVVVEVDTLVPDTTVQTVVK